MLVITRHENPIGILKICIIFLICLSVPGSSAWGKQQAKVPRAVRGVLDLRDWEFDRDGPVRLDGQWDFSWKRLLGPEDPFPGEYAQVPGIWHQIRINGKPLLDKGFATYRLKVILKNPGGLFAVRMKELFSAYRIWGNGKLIYSCGKVGETKAASLPKYASHATPFYVAGNQLVILLQVSNFDYMKGGISDPIQFGPAALVQAERERSLVIDYALFGCLMIMAAYHFALFLLRKEDISTLLFGLFCLIMASRILVADDVYIVTLLPSLSWELRLKILVLGYYLGLPVFASFVNTLYPTEYCPRVMRGIQVLGLAASFMVLVTAPQFYTRTEIYYQGFILLSSLYFLYGIARAMVRKKSGAIWIIFGFLALFFTVLNDILYAQNVAAFSRCQNLLPLGLFFFIFSQSYILSARFSNAFKKANVDHLCQVANRRRFLELAEYEFMKYDRSRAPLCVMTMDVDHFKRVNDTYGHDVGDLVLKNLAKTVSSKIRKQDVFGRMGGEEFSLLLPGIGRETAVAIADRIRRQIRETDIPVKKHKVRVSVSIGIAVMDQHPDRVGVLLKRADLALYQAKDSGRDRVVLWGRSGPKSRQCPGAV